jgi:hypothetical protein
MPQHDRDRLESLKAGILGAIATAVVFSTLLLINSSILAVRFEFLQELRIDNPGLTELIGGAIAAISGFLFGVTYRYVVRDDLNPHLKSGAVAAFGLVRGLAEVDAGLHLQSHNLWWFSLVTLESVLLFAIARIALDIAISQDWFKAFQ